MGSTPRTFKIATIPGDGIGVDVTRAATEVLEKLALAKGPGMFRFEFEEFDWNSENYEKRGWYMPGDGMQQLKKHDAILFGAVGWPSESSQDRSSALKLAWVATDLCRGELKRCRM